MSLSCNKTFRQTSCLQRPRRVEATELLSFHDTSYIEYLASVNLENQKSATNSFEQKYDEFNMGDDCPVFDGLFDFCRLYTGASLDGAVKLNHGLCDIAINWSGGLHHAKKAQASGEATSETLFEYMCKASAAWLIV